jgi:hypothetical protein
MPPADSRVLAPQVLGAMSLGSFGFDWFCKTDLSPTFGCVSQVVIGRNPFESTFGDMYVLLDAVDDEAALELAGETSDAARYGDEGEVCLDPEQIAGMCEVVAASLRNIVCRSRNLEIHKNVFMEAETSDPKRLAEMLAGLLLQWVEGQHNEEEGEQEEGEGEAPGLPPELGQGFGLGV